MYMASANIMAKSNTLAITGQQRNNNYCCSDNSLHGNFDLMETQWLAFRKERDFEGHC